MTTQAQAIIERLEKLRDDWRITVNGVAAAITEHDPIAEARLSSAMAIVSDLDAAIAEIRGMFAELVTVWMGVEESEDEDYVNALCELFASEAAANAWRLEAPGNRSSVEMRVRKRLIPDAQGGTDAK